MACPLALDVFAPKVDGPLVKAIAEITLLIILFSDAARLDCGRLLRERDLPFRLLAIGLPLTMVLGTLVALPMFDGVAWPLLALMALVLAPTDAALGQAVVGSPHVPERIRRAINVESGLNDGIALPPILALLAFIGSMGRIDAEHWIAFALLQLTVGPVAGALVGWGGGRLIEAASKAGWMNPTFQRLSCPALALLAYAAAESFEGNGFIAAFVAGLWLGVRSPEIRERMEAFGEAEGQQLSLLVFLVFGVAAVPQVLPYWDLAAIGYALLSLTLVRMLPVALSLTGAGLHWRGVLFVGWFGPRGIASVLYMLIVVDRIGFEGHERVVSVITLTVLLSIVAHGLTAVPLSRRFGAYQDSATDKP